MEKKNKEEDLNKNFENRAEQLNPNNQKYWKARGLEERPEDWKERVKPLKKQST